MKNKSEFYKNLGAVIHKLRTGKNFTLEQLIQVAGLEIDKSTLSIMEHGGQSISAYQLNLLANALDTTIDNLLEPEELSIDDNAKITGDELKEINNI